MELHRAAPYLRIPEHLLDILQKKETVPYILMEQSFIKQHKNIITYKGEKWSLSLIINISLKHFQK